jgi:hypothetical protein
MLRVHTAARAMADYGTSSNFYQLLIVIASSCVERERHVPTPVKAPDDKETSMIGRWAVNSA